METDQTFAQSSLHRPSPNLSANNFHSKVPAESTSLLPILRIKSSLDIFGLKHAHEFHSACRDPSVRNFIVDHTDRGGSGLPFSEQSKLLPRITHDTRSHRRDAMCALLPYLGSKASETDPNQRLRYSRQMSISCSQHTKTRPSLTILALLASKVGIRPVINSPPIEVC